MILDISETVWLLFARRQDHATAVTQQPRPSGFSSLYDEARRSLESLKSGMFA
jgi:hypothetical protein